jgi:hypothetical protein
MQKMLTKKNARIFGIAAITVANPVAGAWLQLADATQKLIAKPRRRRRKNRY